MRFRTNKRLGMRTLGNGRMLAADRKVPNGFREPPKNNNNNNNKKKGK